MHKKNTESEHFFVHTKFVFPKGISVFYVITLTQEDWEDKNQHTIFSLYIYILFFGGGEELVGGGGGQQSVQTSC